MRSTTQEYIEIAVLIRGVLNGHPGNSAILREFLVNSDAERVTSQVFVLDKRSFPTSSLVDAALEASHGPGLPAISNGPTKNHD